MASTLHSHATYDMPHADESHTDDVRLTRTEKQVVRLIALGCSVKDAAAILGRSVHTVDNHKTRAMKKIGTHNAASLTRYAIASGISPLEDSLSDEERHMVDRARTGHSSEEN